MITMKHNRGIRNDTLTAGMPNNVLQSIMEACNGGNIEPPNIAIIRPAAPNFASSPIPFRAIPYIVGNISDIHADTPTRQYRPYIPSINQDCGSYGKRRQKCPRIKISKNESTYETAYAEYYHCYNVVFL